MLSWRSGIFVAGFSLTLLACSSGGSATGSDGGGSSGGGGSTDSTAPTVGTNISFSGTTDTSVSVSWGAATDSVTAQNQLQYRLLRSTTNNLTSVANAEANGTEVLAYTANQLSQTASGLSASTPYYFAVIVKDAAGNKALYTQQTVTTQAMGSVSAPTFNPVAGTYTSSQNVTISTSTGGATICYRTDGTDPTAPTAGTCGGGSTTYSGAVSIASTATLKALATKSGSTNSGVTSGLYTIDVAPVAGTAISFSAVDTTSTTVNWGAATDAITAQTSLEYKLVKDNSAAAAIDTIAEIEAKTAGDLLMDWTANTTSKSVTGLSSATTYYFAVLVRDAAGNKTIYSPAGQATLTNVYPRYAFDTTGKSVFVVYTSNATNPSKSNGTSVTAAFDVFADPDRRFKAAIPTGAGIRFVFYISNDTLANGFGRTTETNGYQTTWTEGDAYFTHTNTQVYAHYNYDTTGRSVYVVYTTNGTNPSKTNGTSVAGTFDYYDGSTWRRFRGNIPSGANIKYVVYISNDNLANGYGRTSSDGYLITWTEGDSALTLPQ